MKLRKSSWKDRDAHVVEVPKNKDLKRLASKISQS